MKNLLLVLIALLFIACSKEEDELPELFTVEYEVNMLGDVSLNSINYNDEAGIARIVDSPEEDFYYQFKAPEGFNAKISVQGVIGDGEVKVKLSAYNSTRNIEVEIPSTDFGNRVPRPVEMTAGRLLR